MKIISLSCVTEEEARISRRVVAELKEQFPEHKIFIYTTVDLSKFDRVKADKIEPVVVNQAPAIWAFLPMFFKDIDQVVVTRMGTKIDKNVLKSDAPFINGNGVCVVNGILPLTQKAYYDMLSMMRKPSNETTYDYFVETVIMNEVLVAPVEKIEEGLTKEIKKDLLDEPKELYLGDIDKVTKPKKSE